MSLVEAVVLGLVQGLTEFLPISSTAHLRIVPALLGWRDPGAAASAVIQIGTLLAVIFYFWADIVRMTAAFFNGLIRRRPMEDEYSRLAWFLIIGTIPVGVLGLLLKDRIETSFRSLWVISAALIVLALLLTIAEWVATRWERLRDVDEVSLMDTIIIGFGQSLALVPGTSRSGSTIMAGLFRGLSHSAAARFSFLLSIPAVGASGLFELVSERQHLASLGWSAIIVSVLVAFVSGWVSIWFLLRYLRTHTTGIFIYYRIALGVLIIVLLYAGVLTPY